MCNLARGLREDSIASGSAIQLPFHQIAARVQDPERECTWSRVARSGLCRPPRFDANEIFLPARILVYGPGDRIAEGALPYRHATQQGIMDINNFSVLLAEEDRASRTKTEDTACGCR